MRRLLDWLVPAGAIRQIGRVNWRMVAPVDPTGIIYFCYDPFAEPDVPPGWERWPSLWDMVLPTFTAPRGGIRFITPPMGR